MKVATAFLLIAPVFAIDPQERALVVSIGNYPNSTPTIVVLEKDAEVYLRGMQGDTKISIVKAHEMMLGMQYFRVELSSMRLEKGDIWARKIIFIPASQPQTPATPDNKSKPIDR
jgi:hypothetical protein